MMISPGVSTIFQGDVTASFSGYPEGRQKLLGSSLPSVSTRLLYSASAQGWNGTSFRSAATLIRYFRPGSIQMPERSGVPSASFGAAAARFGFPLGRRGI